MYPLHSLEQAKATVRNNAFERSGSKGRDDASNWARQRMRASPKTTEEDGEAELIASATNQQPQLPGECKQ